MHEQVSFPPRTMLKVKWDDLPNFTFPWHFHGEYEIVYVLKSNGTRFVGDNIEKYHPGDITLLGTNLPHFWRSETGNDNQHRVNAIVVQFNKDFFKDEIRSYPEFYKINELLKLSARGVNFTGPESEVAGRMLKKLLKMEGLEQMLYFIKILHHMGSTDNYRLLASNGYQLDGNKNMKDVSTRLDKVMFYINNNYRKEITLEEVASKIGMNRTALSRYFKEKTGKTFIYFVNELRIGYACELLVENKLTVSQICFECGFNNLSNFNRIFLRQTGFTPVAYRLQYLST